MQGRTKQTSRGGRPREFDAGEALGSMQRRLWTAGLSGVGFVVVAVYRLLQRLGREAERD